MAGMSSPDNFLAPRIRTHTRAGFELNCPRTSVTTVQWRPDTYEGSLALCISIYSPAHVGVQRFLEHPLDTRYSKLASDIRVAARAAGWYNIDWTRRSA